MTWNVRNILTFGADGHVRAACEEYARLVARLTEAEALAQNGRAEAAKTLNRLLERKREAVECVVTHERSRPLSWRRGTGVRHGVPRRRAAAPDCDIERVWINDQ
jgi:hypothetical protein